MIAVVSLNAHLAPESKFRTIFSLMNDRISSARATCSFMRINELIIINCFFLFFLLHFEFDARCTLHSWKDGELFFQAFGVNSICFSHQTRENEYPVLCIIAVFRWLNGTKDDWWYKHSSFISLVHAVLQKMYRNHKVL